jgi:hypothetical protein
MTVINPQHARTIIDFTDQASCLLTVATTPVDLSSPYYFLETLDVSYDGKTLQFSEISTQNPGTASFTKNSLVELQLRFTDGTTLNTAVDELATYFKGRIVSADHSGAMHNGKITYVAHGMQNLANQVPAIAGNGFPHLFFGTGFTLVTTFNGTYARARTISSVVQELFEICAPELANYGIPATIGNPGAGTLSGFLDRDTEIKNSTFVDAVKQLLGNQPSKRLYFDDITQTWVFPDLLTSDVTTVTISSVNVQDISYSESIEDKYTALSFYTYWQGMYSLPFRGWAECTPLWTSSSSWAIDTGTGITSISTSVMPENFAVFRQWAIPAITSERHPSFPVRLYAQYGFGRAARFVPFDAYIDMNAGLAVAKFPVHGKGNPYHPGHCKGPAAVYVTWWRADAFESSGTASMRYPGSGFTGTAYDWFGVEKEWKEIVDVEQFTTDAMIERLNEFKDVSIDTVIPFAGDPIQEFINLQKRVRVVHGTVYTRLADITPALVGYTYNFGPVGTSQVKLSTNI